jgi:1,4-dihydroxy-2-naphthoate octaprenyltransferase
VTTASSERSPRSFSRGFWRLADPKISLASFAGLWLGGAAAAREGPLAWGWFALTVLGIFALEVAKNASGEVFDLDSGADLAVLPDDRSPFSGGKRVLVDGLLSRGQTWGIAAGGYLLAITCGLLIALFREPGVFGLGMAGVALAFFYHAPLFRLSYRGWGELAVAIAYGPLVVTGTFLVQRGTVTPWVVAVSALLGLLVAGFLLVNEFPDRRADATAGKGTLVVRLGPVRATWLFLGLMVVVGIGTLLLPLVGASRGVWGGLFALLPASRAIRQLVDSGGRTAQVIPAQAGALMTFLVYAGGAGLGILLVD